MAGQGTPPIGTSPATGPTPNAGNTVRGNQLVGTALSMLAMAVGLIGPATELGQEVLGAVQRIGKKLPPGATSQGGEKEALQQQMMKQQQMGPMMAAARQGAQSPGGPPPSPAIQAS
jgi:hypothetical protein